MRILQRYITRTVAEVAVTALLLIGSAAVSAQPTSRAYRIGLVAPASPGPTVEAFRQGLRELGYVEGQNVVIDARYAEGRAERLPDLVAETLRLNVDVLVVGSTNGALAAKKATATVPIVFAGLIDPVTTGIVASLARPGGNITGATFGIEAAGVAAKWVELLKEAVPGVQQVAVLWSSANSASATRIAQVRSAARALNLRLEVFDAGNPTKLAEAFWSPTRKRPRRSA